MDVVSSRYAQKSVFLCYLIPTDNKKWPAGHFLCFKIVGKLILDFEVGLHILVICSDSTLHEVVGFQSFVVQIVL